MAINLNPYESIDSSLIAAGRLWLPGLTQKFMKRDWGLCEYPFDFQYIEEMYSVSGILGSYTDISAPFYIHFPDDWSEDDTFDDDLNLTMFVRFEARRTLSADVNMRLNTSTGTITTQTNNDITSSSYGTQYEFQITWDGLPTGMAAINIEVKDGDNNDFYVRRTFGASTECYLQII